MPLNGYSVGRDVTLAVTTPSGSLGLNKLTKFSAKQDATNVRVKRLDGITDNVRFPDGWSGTFEVERADSTLDDYIAGIEEGYYAGLNEAPCTITQIIQEPNGKVSEFEFMGVLFTLSNAGEWQGDATVKQSASWVASRRIKRS